GVHDVEDAVGAARARADRVRGVYADGHARQALDDGHVREVNEVAVRVADVRLHAAQAEDDLAVALAREVLGGVQRLVERDVEAALEEDGELLLPPDELQKLEVLRVARADLEHHARGPARQLERVANLFDVRL